MNNPKNCFRPYLEEFRELVDESSWSSAVQSSRTADFQGWVEGDSVMVSVRLQHEKKAVRMEFSMCEHRYLADCSCQDDPCIHLLCGVILANSGWDSIVDAGKGAAPAGTIPYLQYSLLYKDSLLHVERYLCSEDVRKIFSESLVEYIGGISSGRIQAEMPMVGTDDYIVDRALGQKKQTLILKEFFNDTMKALSRLSHVSYEGLKVQVERDSENSVINARISRGGIELVPEKREPEGVFVENGILKWERELPDNLLRYVQKINYISLEEVSSFLDDTLPYIKKYITVNPPQEGWAEIVEVPPRLVFKTESIDSGYSILPLIEYGEPPLAVIGLRGEYEILDGTKLPKRNIAQEIEISKQILKKGRLVLGERKVVTDDQAVYYAELLEGEAVEGSVHKRYIPKSTLVPSIKSTGNEMEVVFESVGDSSESLNLDIVLRSYSNGASVVSLPSGSWARLPENWIKDIIPYALHTTDSGTISSSHKNRVAMQLAPFIGDSGIDVLRGFFNKISEKEDSSIKEKIPGTIRLRSYQEEGVRWVSSRAACKDMGALLADDMGLGKTIQTLASLKFPALVVVPTSLLPQWEDELRIWYPENSLCVYHGAARSWDESSDITLSTYGILRQESELFSSRVFEIIVLDEIQTIKNPESGVTEATCGLRGNFRLGLTGTPIENSVIDLWSIFNFLLPGMLPDPERLMKITETPQGLDVIRKMISPFILRRKKTEVLSELPEKTEILVSCRMESEQQRYYDMLLDSARDEARKYIHGGKGVLSLFEKLLRLRQVCVHPFLIDKGVDKGSAVSSVKIETILDYLERITVSGHKVLLFSQWTTALDIIEPLIASRICTPLRIDGSTTNRASVLNRFKSESEFPVLLLSLKAGGVGLNLTEADHVLFLDPWWNPAVEKQAEDRVYRIGQDNPVFIYRMIVKDSIEEKILELHKRKSMLSEALLEGDASKNSIVSEEDLRFLLSF